MHNESSCDSFGWTVSIVDFDGDLFSQIDYYDIKYSKFPVVGLWIRNFENLIIVLKL